MSHNSKDVILFINSMYAQTPDALRAYEQKTGMHLKPVVIVDSHIHESIHALNGQQHLADTAEVIVADFNSALSIRQALKPYEDRLAAVTCQYENSMHEFRKLIPYVPYLQAPTESSLEWATDKKLMRELFDAYDPTLSPASLQIGDASADTIAEVEAHLSYPIIIKPSGLERSLLVSVAHDQQELTDQLRNTFTQLRTAYRALLKRLEPAVLVEEFMDGDMYSIDTYVAAEGSCRHAPLVKVTTGRQVGFDDFFSYLQATPAGLEEHEIKKAHHAAEQACRALGLRSVSAHVEMMRTTNGWKIIEVGPRIGGSRHQMYELSCGMNHIMNDIINRMGMVPEIPSAPSRYATLLQAYPRNEGILKAIHGLEQIRRLPSYEYERLLCREGDMLQFASNSGDAAVLLMLCNKDQVQLQADISAIERILYIEVAMDNVAVAAPSLIR
jgi:D-alanine-D-alanine ligase-like ATP-grasp enzyme